MKKMWEKIKQSITSGDNSINFQAARDINVTLDENIPTDLIDQDIEKKVENLRKSIFFSEFDRTSSSLFLGRLLVEGNLSKGSDEVRGRGLAWCARLLSRLDNLVKAEEFLELAKTLGDSAEIQIAEAFVLSQKRGKAAALQTLAGIKSDASRSASLMIVAHHDGAEGALQWMNNVGYTDKDLDSDGKYFLLDNQLQLGHWDDASRTADTFSDSDFKETPSLHHLTGLTKLVAAVPSEFRNDVLTQVPLIAEDFPLASDAGAMDVRRAAHGHFLAGVEAARQLTCPCAERTDDEYALWLELRDPAQSEYGKKRLKDKLRDPNTELGFVHYAPQFGIKLDLDAVERSFEKSISINGTITKEAARARCGLALTKPPEEAANYIARHHNQLETYFGSKWMLCLQIKLLSLAGRIERANAMLDQLLDEGIPAEQESNLRRIISEGQGNDPVESRKAQYKKTGALDDLISLVAGLEEHQHWDDLCDFGKHLFEKTCDLTDAEHLVRAFNKTYRSEELVEFLNENTDLLAQSRHLQMSYAWGLYNEGALLESRAELAKLSESAGSPNYRALQVELGIAMGDWASLSAYIVSEYQNRNDRSPHDLMHAAQLALHIESTHAKNLVFEAAAKAGNDAEILAAAYFLATSAGWEHDPRVVQWFEQATKLSDDNGPLQKMSLKDILERKSKWDHRESEIWRLFAQGRIPIFMAAQSLNQTLIDLMTFPALANLSETDPRQRRAIPAYSGNRIPQQYELSGKKVALDATALLTLSFLEILDEALDAFETVYIPHSTLGWLFEEQHKAAFHQPSRIANARQVQDFLATDVLEKFTPSTVASSELSAQIGDELAALIAEAERVREGDGTQHIVVCSAPVHRLSNLMWEEADLSSHAAVLSSCLAVVAKLKQKAQITAEEEERASTYLQLHEKPWPNQPEISDGATLYLDGLAITYLLHLGLLGKIKDAGLRPVISPREVSEAGTFIAYERISDKVKAVIERIRASLNSRIESRRVRVSSRCKFDEAKENLISDHIIKGIIALAPHCDVVIVDDRSMNQKANICSGGTLAPILSTLDLLDALVSADVISDDDRLEYRTKLRRAGYFFVPVNEEELERYLRASDVIDGNVVETAELKAIRESVLCARMSDRLQLPNEEPWLNATLKAFVKVLKSFWQYDANIDEVTARSNWLADQVDVRGWAHRLVPENADNVVHINPGKQILLQILWFPVPLGIQQDMVDAYWSCVEDRILAPIKEQFPDLYDRLVECYRNEICEMDETELSKMAETELSEENRLLMHTPFARAAMAQAALKLVPPLIRKSLLNEREFREAFGFKIGTLITFESSGVSVQLSVLFDAFHTILAGADDTEVLDEAGGVWRLKNEADEDAAPILVLLADDRRLKLPDFSVLSDDAIIRIRYLEESAIDVNLPTDAKERWRLILAERALNDDEVDPLYTDIRNTPVYVERSIRSGITAGQGCNISSLVPNSLRYFQSLVGTYDGSASIKDYACGAGRTFFGKLSEWQPYEGFLYSLLLSSHSALTAEISVDQLDRDKLVQAYDFIEGHGDTLSCLGAFEVGLRVLQERPEVEPFLLRLVHRIRDDNVESNASEFKLLSDSFILVDGELSRTRLMAGEPPFYRRLASLAQAGLIHRQFVQARIDYGLFLELVFGNRDERYYMQSLADMRTEPRWNPNLVSAQQMREDFFGRIIIAGKSFEDNIGTGELFDTIFGSDTQSLSTLCEFPRPYFPGPLEGAEDSPNPLPEDLSNSIKQQLDTEEVETSSFFALVNYSLIFKITSSHAELAAKALRLSNYQIANLEDNFQLVCILDGLATVAAISRNSSLAEELRITVLCYLRDPQFGFSIEEAMRFCLVASAAREDLVGWREFAGEWLTELAFKEMDRNEAETFHSRLIALLHSVPELWVSCARADAALKALCSS